MIFFIGLRQEKSTVGDACVIISNLCVIPDISSYKDQTKLIRVVSGTHIIYCTHATAAALYTNRCLDHIQLRITATPQSCNQRPGAAWGS